MFVLTHFSSQLRKMLILLIRSHCKIWLLPTIQISRVCSVGNGQILLQKALFSKIHLLGQAGKYLCWCPNDLSHHGKHDGSEVIFVLYNLNSGMYQN